MCSKMDFLSENEHIQDEISKFKECIKKGMQLFQSREKFIEDLIQKMSGKIDPLYKDQAAMQEFLNKVATNISGGQELVRLF